MLVLLYIVLFLSLAATVRGISYCGARMCGRTNAHTFCQFSEGASSTCIGYIEAPLTREDRARLIARFNRRRNETAVGKLYGTHPAGDMLKLRWVEELAREAQRWADQCRPPRIPEERDVCRDLYSTSIGQCVASVVGEAPGLRIESMVDLWYMQSRHYKGNITYYIPPQHDGAFYGDFAQIMWSKTYMVGCGRSRFMSPIKGRFRTVERLVCNFAPRGPQPCLPLWSQAAPATSCPSRAVRDRTLTALCNYQPNIIAITDTDPSMTINEQIILNTILEIEGNETLNYFGSQDEMYLTKIAMITMKDITTLRTNSLQKRDVAEMVLIEDAKAELTLSDLNNDIIAEQVIEMKENGVTTEKPKKLNLIGRPKTYEIEELNNVFEENIENEKRMTTENEDKEFNGEYELIDEDKHTKKSELSTNTLVVNEKYVNNNEIIKVTKEEEKSTQAHTADPTTLETVSTLSIKEKEVIANNTLEEEIKTNISLLLKENNGEYLSDSETVQELQRALEQMERSMAPESEHHGKVRREITDSAAPRNDEVTSETDKNKGTEKGPMMSMILKYMPYLKDYQSSVLGSAVSEANKLVPCGAVLISFIRLL